MMFETANKEEENQNGGVISRGNHFRKKRTCEVNRMGENSSFTFTCYVKTVPVYDFKLVWVVLHPCVKEFFKKIY